MGREGTVLKTALLLTSISAPSLSLWTKPQQNGLGSNCSINTSHWFRSPDFTRTLEENRAVLGETAEESVVLTAECGLGSHLASTDHLLTHHWIMLLIGLSSATLKCMLNFLERSQSYLHPSTQACPVPLTPLPPASPTITLTILTNIYASSHIVVEWC